MKTKMILLAALASSALVLPAGAASRGQGNSGRAPASRPATCDLSGPGAGTPLRDGSGRARQGMGNPNSTGTPLRDGSGKATAPGRGPKDGTGNQANCPVVPRT